MESIVYEKYSYGGQNVVKFSFENYKLNEVVLRSYTRKLSSECTKTI